LTPGLTPEALDDPPRAERLPHADPLPHILTAPGPYRHPASGMQFPTGVGEFTRVTVVRYDRDGLRVSAGYNLTASPPRIAATVFVYPPPAVPGTREEACRGEFAAGVAEIRRTYPGAVLVEERDVVHQQGDTAHPGRLARFTYETMFAGTKQTVGSQLLLFCHVGGKWQVKYRFTHPVGLAAEPEIAAFLQQLGWTIGGERAARDRSTESAG
jgi:hypothetical protein